MKKVSHITTDQEVGGGSGSPAVILPIYSTPDLGNTLTDFLRGAHSSKASHADKDEPLQRVKGELVKAKLCPERGGAKNQMCGGWRTLLEE